MPSIISTASADCWYDTKEHNPQKDMWRRKRGMLIKGGANVGGKHIVTPQGVVTHVTDEELEFLESLPAFQRHKAAGHVKVVKSEAADGNKVAKDMTKKDKSAPLTPDDFSEEKRPNVGNAEPVIQKVAKKAKG